MNQVWLWMILLGVAVAAARPDGGATLITQASAKAAEQAVTFAFSLIGVIALWSGLMKIAEQAGLTATLARLLSPLLRPLFPGIPRDDPALGAIMLSISANLLGLGNAATPLGLKAMQELERLNPTPGRASDAMCTFVAVTTSGITLIPSVVLAMRAAAGSHNASAIIGPTLVTTVVATTSAVLLDRLLRRFTASR